MSDGSLQVLGRVMRVTLRLPPRIDLTAVSGLAADLRRAEGGALDIDAGEVRHLGALGLQVLAAAALSWRAAGAELRIVDPSPEFTDALATFGVSLDSLCAPEAPTPCP